MIRAVGNKYDAIAAVAVVRRDDVPFDKKRRMQGAVMVAMLAAWTMSAAADESMTRATARNQIIVSPQGPTDGGDFGPHTPGTQTSGLQEALHAAKAQAKDVYIAGGSWTADQTTPVVYQLHTTLHVPWMQNFRLESGHCVLNYTGKTGDAVVFDSQMSCAYRWGLIVSMSDGAVVRLKPETAGPDRFQVITSTEFTFNALVGGGGAWPGGAPHQSTLDPRHDWLGVGLVLDGQVGSIDANKITVVETVGCATGLQLTGRVTRNTIDALNIHLCRNQLRLGGEHDSLPGDNRIAAYFDSQGIPDSSGAEIWSSRNLLTLSVRNGLTRFDLRWAPTASDNVVIHHSPLRVVNDATAPQQNTLLGPHK